MPKFSKHKKKPKKHWGGSSKPAKVLSADAGWVEGKLKQELGQISRRIMKQRSLIALLMAGAAAGVVGACLTLVAILGSGNFMLLVGTAACVGLAALCAYGAVRARRLLRRLQGAYIRRKKALAKLTSALNWI